MANRLALVVDDSKTARVTLKRMLENHGVETETVDSARAAIDYLVGKTPAVIFMDHMMPDMDGFEAVEAIKGNPDTASIPIMMYTSKGGEQYVSQARALGAIGILPKQAQPAELYSVLENLGLVKNRRIKPVAESNFVLLDDATEVTLSAASGNMQEIARQAADSLHNNNVLSDSVIKVLEQGFDTLQGDVAQLRQAVDALPGIAGQSRSRRRHGGGLFVPLVVLLVMLIPLMWLFKQHEQTRQTLDAAHGEITRLQTTIQQQQAAASQENESLRRQLDSQSTSSSEHSDLLFNSITWAVNQSSPVDVHEEAFSDRRLATVYELISRLQALGFRGVVQLNSHLGEFCLTGNEADGYSMAAADLPVRDCSFYGHPLQQLPSIGARQSIAFANFLSTSPLVNNSGISIEIVNHGYSEPRVEYPSRESDITAWDWNRIAATNNRVEVTLIPSGG
jgi:CheY-like chemotaxis protein